MLSLFLCFYFIWFQTYVIKFATTQIGRAYGGSGGQSEMMLNDSTVITQALEAIAPTIRTFLEADVCIFQVFSSLIRFQESPASVAVYVTVEYIRDDRFVMQCDECKKVTLQEVCAFQFSIRGITSFQDADSCAHCRVGVLKCRLRLWMTGRDSVGAMRQLCLFEVSSILILVVVKLFVLTGTCQSTAWRL